jgi:hypothetical protein
MPYRTAALCISGGRAGLLKSRLGEPDTASLTSCMGLPNSVLRLPARAQQGLGTTQTRRQSPPNPKEALVGMANALDTRKPIGSLLAWKIASRRKDVPRCVTHSTVHVTHHKIIINLGNRKKTSRHDVARLELFVVIMGKLYRGNRCLPATDPAGQESTRYDATLPGRHKNDPETSSTIQVQGAPRETRGLSPALRTRSEGADIPLHLVVEAN